MEHLNITAQTFAISQVPQSPYLCKFRLISTNKQNTFVCTRCKMLVLTPYEDASKIYSYCNGKPGLGDRVASTLSFFGITKAKVQWVKRMFGSTKPCGCQERQTALNELGEKIGF